MSEPMETQQMAAPSDRYEIAGDLPLTIRPRNAGEADLGQLCAWLEKNSDWVQDALLRHGALRFRGFAVEDAPDFERLARAIEADLKREYLGTSPRDAVTGYVFNASELPDFYPIPQHCEMSFCAHPPERVFFCCLVEPAEGSGETPLCDFRKVWRDLDPDVRQRFEAGGLRVIRNYSGPGADDSDDPLRLKRWDEMFQTTDRSVIEAKCREEGFTPSWHANDGLRLISTHPIYRDHPVTGERVWHNHLTTFHRATAEAEYERIARFRPTDRHRALLELARALEEKQRGRPVEEQSMHTTYVDGREIPQADLDHVRDVVWRHMVIEPWRRGDVVAIDNHSTSHGRLPYEGPRRIVVCWA
jgi:alpha-ketoglutarate-dependent taurine dioxygenase